MGREAVVSCHQRSACWAAVEMMGVGSDHLDESKQLRPCKYAMAQSDESWAFDTVRLDEPRGFLYAIRRKRGNTTHTVSQE